MLIALLTACTPALDWREVRPEVSGAVLLFPCKPSVEARPVMLAGASVPMRLVVCRADGVTWAVSYADVTDPTRVAPAIEALQAAARNNLGGMVETQRPWQVKGMTPNPLAQRMRVRGKLPNGEAVVQETGFFSRGTWVFQATAMGERLDGEAVATFFDSIRWP